MSCFSCASFQSIPQPIGQKGRRKSAAPYLYVGHTRSIKVSDLLDSQVLNLAMSSASLVTSLALLFIHFKNRKTQVSSYFLARATYRASSIDLKFVSSEQREGNVLIKLVLFNPGSIATLIQSLTVYKEVESRFFLFRFFGRTEWKEVDDAKWWPTSDPSCKDQKYFADEYKSLYVEDCRDIYVLLPGYINRSVHRFAVETNHGGYSHSSTIDATRTYFSHAFRRWFHET